MFIDLGHNRSCELTKCPARELFGWLTIRLNGSAAVYEVETGESENVYLMRQFSPKDADEIYECALVRKYCYCNCTGFRVRKACKHSAAFEELDRLGLLAGGPQVIDEPPF